MNREDFPILDTNIIYFDNAATTLKPKSVVDEIVKYYTLYTANAHRGDYDNSLKVDNLYEGVRTKVKELINADSEKEIVFTKGATESLNMIVKCYMKYVLKAGDEVLLSKAEHASLVLPWLELEKELGIVIKYIDLDSDFKVTYENIMKKVTNKTKVIALAQVSNVISDERPIKELGKFTSKSGIYLVIDGAQSVPHMKVDVQDLNIDFLAFSSHKMLGPTGVGVLYGKYKYLDKMHPLTVGGGMNNYFEANGDLEYNNLPTRLEAGTQNISGVIGLGKAIDYLNNLGYDKIKNYEKELRDYLIKELERNDNVIIYNKNSGTNTIVFNVKGIFPQDTAVYLNTKRICIRAGNHCAKLLKDEVGIKNTCRISLYFYNTKEEIDKLIEALKEKDILKMVI